MSVLHIAHFGGAQASCRGADRRRQARGGGGALSPPPETNLSVLFLQSSAAPPFGISRQSTPKHGPRGALKGGGGAPPSSRAPSPRSATVSLTPSARFNGICKRQ